MIIPPDVSDMIDKTSDPLQNSYLNHARRSITALNKITEDTYCSDYYSNAVNCLERVYKGFLEAARLKCPWYSLPVSDFLTNDHRLSKLTSEIRVHFPEVLPRCTREEMQAQNRFLRELQHEYTDARYVTNPDFTEFSQLIKYVTAQQELITDYIKSPSFKKDCKTDYGDDENDSADGDER